MFAGSVCVCVCVWPRCDCQHWAEVGWDGAGGGGGGGDGGLWLQSKTAKHTLCFRQGGKTEQFPADGRRGRLLWKHKRSTQVLSPSSSPRGTPGWNERTVPSALVNGAPPSSSQADMLLSNGQSPLQLGPSSPKLDQYSETVCLFGRTRCKMVSVLTFKHGWKKGLRLLWQDQEKCVRRGGSPSWKLEY